MRIKEVKRGRGWLAWMVNVLSLLKAIVSQIFVKRIERSFTSFFMVCWGLNRQSLFLFLDNGPSRANLLPHLRRATYGLSLVNLWVSQVEWELVEIHIAGDGANFWTEASDLVGQHAWSGDLNGVVPIVVIVTKRISEVKNRHLRDLGRVLGHIEVSGLDWALGHRVRNEEEVKLPVDNFRLLNKAVVDVGTLRWVVNEVWTVVLLGLLEESLADSLVHDDKSNLRSFLLRLFFDIVATKSVLKGHDLVELGQFLVDDLLTHRVTYTISVDENMLGHLSIEVSVALEGALEVIWEDSCRNNFLALDWLWTGLSVVLAEVRVVGSAETNGTLLTLVTHINSDEHGLIWNFLAEGHPPEVTTEFGVHLPDDIKEDTVVVFNNSSIRHKLRNDRAVTVDLVFQERIEVLMICVIWHDHEEYEVWMLNLALRLLNNRKNLLIVVVLDTLGESVEQVFLMHRGLVRHWTDVCVLNLNV